MASTHVHPTPESPAEGNKVKNGHDQARRKKPPGFLTDDHHLFPENRVKIHKKPQSIHRSKLQGIAKFSHGYKRKRSVRKSYFIILLRRKSPFLQGGEIHPCPAMFIRGTDTLPSILSPVMLIKTSSNVTSRTTMSSRDRDLLRSLFPVSGRTDEEHHICRDTQRRISRYRP